jgi:hypothetical protein
MTITGNVVAGDEIGLIHSSAEATPDWLTRVLRSSGALPGGASVTAVDAEQFAQGSGLLSELFRLTPTYEGGDGPATVVLKLPTRDPAMRGVADALSFYQREHRFYLEIAHQVPFATAACHATITADDGTTDFVLVLEDLGPLRQLDQVAGCSWDETLGVLDDLAAFHARWWDHESLPDLATTFLPVRNDMYVAVLPQLYAPGWAVAKEVAGDLLTPELLAFGDRWSELCGPMLEQVNEPSTLIHGDWRSDNLFLDDEGRLTVIDFQIVSTGSGLSDVGYFVSQSLEPEVRQGRDREIVDAYLARLTAHGVTLDEAEAWRQYRMALCFCLTYPVTSFQAWAELPERGHDLVRSMLRRSLAAITDTNALEVLPA